jgi:hypothetical protein
MDYINVLNVAVWRHIIIGLYSIWFRKKKKNNVKLYDTSYLRIFNANIFLKVVDQILIFSFVLINLKFQFLFFILVIIYIQQRNESQRI